jgi:short-subunit dehydrogenase
MTKYFLQLGANVTITSRKLDVLEGTARELEAETGGKVLPVACDVRNYGEVENMLAETGQGVRAGRRPAQQRGRQLHQPHRKAFP